MAIPSEKSELDLNKLNTEFQTNSGDAETKLSDFYGKTNDLPTSGEIKYSDFFGVDFLPEPPSGTQISTDWQYREEENDWVDNGVVSGEGKLLISDVSEQSGETISYERFEVVVVGEAGLEWSLDENYTASYNYTRYTAGDFTDTGTRLSWKGWQKSNVSGGSNVETSTPVTEYVTINNYSNFGYTPTDNYDDGYRIYTYDGNENYPDTLYYLPGTTYFKERSSTTGTGIGAQEAVTTSNASNIDYWQGYSGAKYVLQPDGTDNPDENGYYKWVVGDTQGEFWSLGTGADIPLVTRSVGSTDVAITPSNAAENGFTQSNTGVDESGYTKWTRDSDSAEFWAKDNVFYTKESWTASGSNLFPATNSFTAAENPGNNYWKNANYKTYIKASFTATSNLGNTKAITFDNATLGSNPTSPFENDTPSLTPLPSTYSDGTEYTYRCSWGVSTYYNRLEISIDDIFYLNHPAYNGTPSGGTKSIKIQIPLDQLIDGTFNDNGVTILNRQADNSASIATYWQLELGYQGLRFRFERGELQESWTGFYRYALKYVPPYSDTIFTANRLTAVDNAYSSKGHFEFGRGSWKYDKPPSLNTTYDNMMFKFAYNQEFLVWDARQDDEFWLSWWSKLDENRQGEPHKDGTDWFNVSLNASQIANGTLVTGYYGESWKCLDFWTQSVGGSKRNRYNPYYSATQAANFLSIITHLKIEYYSNNGNTYIFWFKKGSQKIVDGVSGYYYLSRWNAGLITRYDAGEAYYALNYEYYDYDYTTASLGGSSATWEYSAGVSDYRKNETSYYIYENVELTRTVTSTVFVPDGVVYYSQNLDPPTALHTRTGQAGSPSTTVTLTTSNYRDSSLSGYNIVKKPGTLEIYTGVEKPFSTSSWSGNINFWKVDITSTGYNYSITVDNTVIITNLSWSSELTAYTHTDGKTYHRGTYQSLLSNEYTLYFAVRADGFLTEHDWFQGGAPYDYLCIPTGQTGALYTYTLGAAGGSAPGQEYTVTEHPDYSLSTTTMETHSVIWERGTTTIAWQEPVSDYIWAVATKDAANVDGLDWPESTSAGYTRFATMYSVTGGSFWDVKYIPASTNYNTVFGDDSEQLTWDTTYNLKFEQNPYGTNGHTAETANLLADGRFTNDTPNLFYNPDSMDNIWWMEIIEWDNNRNCVWRVNRVQAKAEVWIAGEKIYDYSGSDYETITSLSPDTAADSVLGGTKGYLQTEPVRVTRRAKLEGLGTNHQFYYKFKIEFFGQSGYRYDTEYFSGRTTSGGTDPSNATFWEVFHNTTYYFYNCFLYIKGVKRMTRFFQYNPVFNYTQEYINDIKNQLDNGLYFGVDNWIFKRGTLRASWTEGTTSTQVKRYAVIPPFRYKLWWGRRQTRTEAGTGTATWKWEGADIKTETGVTAPSAGPHALSNKNYYLGTKDTSLSTDNKMYWTIYRTYSETGSDITIDESPPIRGGNLTFDTVGVGDNYTFTQHTDTKVIRTPLEYIPYTPLFTHADAKRYFYRQFTVADGDAFENDGTLPEWEVNSSASYNWLENLSILNYELYTVRKNTSNPAGPLVSDTSVTATIAPTKTYVTEVNIAQRINFSIEAPTDDTNNSKIVGYKLVKNQRRFDAGEVVGDEAVNLGYIYPEDGTYFQYNGSDKIFVVVEDTNGFYRLIWRCYQKTQLSVLGTNQKDHGVWGSTSSVQFSGEDASILNGGLTINVFRFGGSDKVGIDIWLEKRIIHTPAYDTYDIWAVCKCFDIFRYPIGNTTTTSQANSDFIDIFNTDI